MLAGRTKTERDSRYTTKCTVIFWCYITCEMTHV